MTKKTFNTLIQDIEKVLLEGRPVPPSLWEKYEPILRESIISSISQDRQGEERKHLWASELGLPDRKVWANHNWTDVEDDIRYNARAMFLFGHIWEPLYLMLAELAGHTVEQMQERIEIKDDDGNVICSGRRDAVIDGVPVDVKTAAARSFAKFKDGTLAINDLFGYIPQLGFYLQNGEPSPDEAAFVVADRAMGHMTTLTIVKEDFPDTKERAKHLWNVIQQPEPPEKCYDSVPTTYECKKLDVGCAYCKFKFRCWADSNDGQGVRTIIQSSGPQYIVEIGKRLPAGIELDEHGELLAGS